MGERSWRRCGRRADLHNVLKQRTKESKGFGGETDDVGALLGRRGKATSSTGGCGRIRTRVLLKKARGNSNAGARTRRHLRVRASGRT